MTDGPDLAELDAPAPAASREGQLLPWLWILVGALLIAAVVSAFVHDGEPDAGGRVAAAAAAVDDAGSFAYALALESSGPFAAAITIDGSVDTEAGRFTSSMQLAGSAVEIVGDGDVLYVQVPEGARQNFGGKPWARFDAEALTAGFGGVLPSGTPMQTFAQLRDAGKVEKVSEEEVRGVATTHLRTFLDLSDSVPQGAGTDEVREALREVEVHVWLDDQDRIRRHRTTLEPGTGAGLSLVTTIETFDFGKAVTIEVPPADQVHDAGTADLESLFSPAPAPAPAD